MLSNHADCHQPLANFPVYVPRAPSATMPPMDDETYYETLRANAEATYRATRPTFSPALNETVEFQEAGFDHIIFSREGRERDRASQIARLQLLSAGYSTRCPREYISGTQRDHQSV